MNNTLALITTVYNDYTLLAKLLESLLNQTSGSFVHYIFDDGSSEIDYELINNYIEASSHRKEPFKVVFIQNDENIGCQKAHEYMFRYVSEPYFSWIDSDDSVNKNFVSIVLKNIKKHPETTVFHINSIIYYDVNYKTRKKHSTGYYYSQKELKRKDQFINYCFDSESKFYHEFVVKKSDLLKVNPNIEIFTLPNEYTSWYDEQIMFQLSLAGVSFYYIKKPLSNIYLRPVSVSRNPNAKKIINVFEIIKEKLCFSSDRISLYLKIGQYKSISESIIDNLKNNDIKMAKSLLKSYKRGLKADGFSNDYIINFASIKKLFLKKRFRYFYSIYKHIKLFQ